VKRIGSSAKARPCRRVDRSGERADEHLERAASETAVVGSVERDPEGESRHERSGEDEKLLHRFFFTYTR